MAQFTTQLTVVGNLTRDPELRYTQNGQPVVSFSVASTPRAFNKETKEYEDGEAVFTNCTLWGKPAEHFAASATKGSRVILTGSFKSRTYQDKEQNTKTATDLIVDEIGMSTTFSPYTKGGSLAQRHEAQDSGFFPDAGDDTPF